jgi:hypothetical protein
MAAAPAALIHNNAPMYIAGEDTRANSARIRLRALSVHVICSACGRSLKETSRERAQLPRSIHADLYGMSVRQCLRGHQQLAETCVALKVNLENDAPLRLRRTDAETVLQVAALIVTGRATWQDEGPKQLSSFLM